MRENGLHDSNNRNMNNDNIKLIIISTIMLARELSRYLCTQERDAGKLAHPLIQIFCG
jgi:hypothetical protein